MKALESFLSRLAPYDCINCGDEGALLCTSCIPLLGSRLTSKCIGCYIPTLDFSVCRSCFPKIQIDHVFPAFAYKGAAKNFIHEFKFEGKRGAAKEIANLLELPIGVTKQTIVVHTPTSTRRVRERGYDQAKLLAKAIAARHDLIYIPMLIRISNNRQLGALRRERFKNIEGAYRVKGSYAKDAHILLVDDVVTTGATLAEAARTLRAAGATCVDANFPSPTPSPSNLGAPRYSDVVG